LCAVKPVLHFFGWILLLLVLAACQSTENGATVVPPPDSPVVLRVGSHTVTVADFEQQMDREIGPAIADLLAQGQSREEIEQLALDSAIRRSIFDRIVQDELLMRYARQNGLGVDAAAVDAAVLPQFAFGANLPLAAQTDQRLASSREQLVFEVIARNTRTAMFKARHILVADEATARQVLSEVEAGGDFAALAEQYSQDPVSAAAGGELGWVPRGDFVPEFEEAAFSAELNTPILVQSQFGWHVIEVLDRSEDRPFDSFEQLRASSNAQQFYEQSFLPWYEQLLRDTEASGDLVLAPGFDPESVPLPFPDDQ
jgi:peptidyl-prolyl cis-trans isomerase C